MNPLRPQRKHVRMRNFDYTTPGAYFFTICLHERRPLFGDVREDQAIPNEIGQMILDIWGKTSEQFPSVEPDTFILMPDHAHGIWTLSSVGGGNSSASLIQVMQWFKSITTVSYGRGVEVNGWPRYDRWFWQQDYYERYLRDEYELEQKREYILANPGRWEERNQ